MDFSDLHHHFDLKLPQQQPQQQQLSSGLTRYRSAPSSYFASFLETDNYGGSHGGYGGIDDLSQLLNPRFSGRGEQRAPATFTMNKVMGGEQYATPVKHEENFDQSQQLQQQQQIRNEYDEFLAASKMGFNSRVEAEQHCQTPVSSCSSAAADDSYSFLNSGRVNQLKMDRSTSNLVRYNSSPAGFFAQINIDKEFGAMQGMGSFGAGNSASAEASSSSSNRFKSHLNYKSSLQQSASSQLASISEIIDAKGTEQSGTNLREDHGGDHKSLNTDFPFSNWDDPAFLTDDFLNELEDDDNKAFSNASALNVQKSEVRDRPPTVLSHHLSLPKSSTMEKLLKDSVPCKVRARRGCATHPRSIAERVRRTRISERMRKLQELVPNMDKQTSTADMLDLAVDYIKDLEDIVKKLSENRAKCQCSNR